STELRCRWWKPGGGSMTVCPVAEVDASAAARIAGRSGSLTTIVERPDYVGPDDIRSAVPKPAVRSLALCGGLLCAAIGPASAEGPSPPFVPPTGASDYVVTMVQHGRQGDTTHTIMHHDKWARVETNDGKRIVVGYYTPHGPTEVTIYRGNSGDI